MILSLRESYIVASLSPNNHTGYMETFADYFSGRPLVPLLIGGLFFAVFLLGLRSGRPGRMMLLLGILWVLWGIWEWLILRYSPDSDIRSVSSILI